MQYIEIPEYEDIDTLRDDYINLTNELKDRLNSLTALLARLDVINDEHMKFLTGDIDELRKFTLINELDKRGRV